MMLFIIYTIELDIIPCVKKRNSATYTKTIPCFCIPVPFLACSSRQLPFKLIKEVGNMEIKNRWFPYEKSIVINALYDTIEALGLSLDSSNSVRGTLIVSDAQHTGSMRVALDAAGHTDRTQVHIYPHDVGKNIINADCKIKLNM